MEKRQQLQFLERQTKNQKKRDKEALIDELVSQGLGMLTSPWGGWDDEC